MLGVLLPGWPMLTSWTSRHTIVVLVIVGNFWTAPGCPLGDSRALQVYVTYIHTYILHMAPLIFRGDTCDESLKSLCYLQTHAVSEFVTRYHLPEQALML